VSENALTVEVQDIQGLKVDVVTVGCAGDCVDVVAVASGGHPPYEFAWDDDPREGARRRLCADTPAELTLTVNDTSIDDPEFHYAPQTAHAKVTVDVLECPDAGGLPDATVPDDCVSTEPGPTGADAGVPQPLWQTCAASSLVMEPTDFVISDCRPSARFAAYDNAPSDQEYSTAKLCVPLEGGKARSIQLGRGPGGPNHLQGDKGDSVFSNFAAETSLSLELWGGDGACAKQELLWQMDPVGWSGWFGNACATLQPTQSHTHLTVVWHATTAAGRYRTACLLPALVDPSSCTP
jgi:hypothetical protein